MTDWMMYTVALLFFILILPKTPRELACSCRESSAIDLTRI